MYYKAKCAALQNGHDFHVVALLYRGKSLIKIGTNLKKTHPKSYKEYPRGGARAFLHAEGNVLRFSRPGDKLIVLRFHKNGDLSMAKPCEHCQKAIKKHQISEVFYSDFDGNIQEME